MFITQLYHVIQMSCFSLVSIVDKEINCVFVKIKKNAGTSLVVQQLSLHAPNAGGLGLIPGWGTRSHMHAATKTRRSQINK